MAQAKWHELTPARKQLLVALVIAVLVFLGVLGRQLDSAAQLRDAGQQKRPADGPDR